MGLLDIFNKGLNEIQAQEAELKEETTKLIKDAETAKSGIDKAVEQLELAREATQTAKDNIIWVEIAIKHNTSPHTHSILTDLYQTLNQNEREEVILSHIEAEQFPIARAGVLEVTDVFQGSVNEFEEEADKLSALVTEHSSESNEKDLRELADRFHTIVYGQIADVNKHLNAYGFDSEIR